MTQAINELESVISKDKDTFGFDLTAGQTWIYPTNYEIREYQYNITHEALFKNTLVSLPTGLGKTFIAAVVMYNFYRWYPMGKIIFMAPTKPLVKQQQDACYNIVAMPRESTAEMTGSKMKAARIKIWKENRVFFITPQILQNDIDVILDLAQQIKCIVIDEAHKALGKNANCEAIKKIQKLNQNFRILALSATPGSNFNSIRDIITNLLISHIEVRTNESVDVAPYVFQRKLDIFTIPITGELLNVKNKYFWILDKYVRPLLQLNIFSGNCANLTKGKVLFTMKEFKEKGRQHNKYGFILKSLNICVTLYHGYELLIRHGLRSFLIFFNETVSKPLFNCINELHDILNDVRNYIGPLEDITMLPDGTIPEVNGPVVFSHPKFEKLTQVLQEHFTKTEDCDTRVMVFCEYRESVLEIYSILLRQRPLIKPRIFLGQGSISQAKQLQAVKNFKSGNCNTLISTCIGEEGLDVGEVDLIICFDISTKSPIRMVQRMGRTGRKRDGRVVVLVTEGKEQQMLTECLAQKNNMTSLLESQQIKQCLNINNPRMVPIDINPECNKVYITVKEPEKPKKKVSKANTNIKNVNTLKNMFESISSQSSSQKSENSEKSSHKKHCKEKVSTTGKNQIDIRSMFSKMSNSQSTINKSQIFTQNSIDNKTEEDSELDLIVAKTTSYLDSNIIKTKCKICDIFDCKLLCSTVNYKITKKWTKPNITIINSLSSESLKRFTEIFTSGKATDESTTQKKNEMIEKTLQFFNLSSINDIFLNNTKEIQECLNKIPNFNESVVKCLNSENIRNQFYEENIVISDSDSELSPILSTQKCSDYREKIKEKLFSQHNTITKSHNNSNDQLNDNLCNQKYVCDKNSQTKIKEYVNMSTPKNVTNLKTNYNVDFWDESLFEICGSDESMFECEFPPLEPENSEPKVDLSKTNEKDYDSDETIILSFNADQIIEGNKKEENLELENEEKLLKLNTNTDNILRCNEPTNTSLLSVTQAIELLNDSKYKNCNTSVGPSQIKYLQSVQKNDKEISKNVTDESDEEFSLLSLSQNRKRKLSKNYNRSINNTEENKFNEFPNQFISQISKDDQSNISKNKNVLQDKYDSTNSCQNVNKLSNTQKIPQLTSLKKNCDDNLKKNVTVPPKQNLNANKRIVIFSDSDDDDFAIKPEIKRTCKKTISDFIDDMAEVENDEHYISDSDEDTQNDVELDSSFISNTQNILDQTDMTAKYLQSIRSPKFKPGIFKIPRKLSPRIYDDVFSQIEDNENDTYMNDSFCVGNDETLSQREGLSYLEKVEVQLEKENKETRCIKRKRIITLSDSD